MPKPGTTKSVVKVPPMRAKPSPQKLPHARYLTHRNKLVAVVTQLNVIMQDESQLFGRKGVWDSLQKARDAALEVVRFHDKRTLLAYPDEPEDTKFTVEAMWGGKGHNAKV